MESDVVSCLKKGIEFLETHRVPEAQASAEILLAHVLERPRGLLWFEERTVRETEECEFLDLLDQRAKRYPLPYLLKSIPFRNTVLWVGEGCLIPRPETELLTELVLAKAPEPEAPIHILEVGTGSGNIAVSLAQERPAWQVTATDISERALGFAKVNAERNKVAAQIRLIAADLWSGIGNALFDALVSNPPYLSAEDRANMQAELRFEPPEALDGGEDGLLFYRRMVDQAPLILKQGGIVFFEVGRGQAQAVCRLLECRGFAEVKSASDYNGIERMVWGRLVSHG